MADHWAESYRTSQKAIVWRTPVNEGEVEVRLPNGTARTLGPHDRFGEMAIVDHSPRFCTVVATADTKLAVIDRHMFLLLVHETPTFALHVMSSIAERLRAETC